MAVLIFMPNLKSKKVKQIIQCLDVRRHTVEINTDQWTSLLKEAKLNHVVTRTVGTYAISRGRLLSMPSQPAEDKCLEILMWGFPSGQLFNMPGALENLKEIAGAASTKCRDWDAYYEGFPRGWRVNTSSITKFAYFFGQKFKGDKAVILDNKIAATLNSERWTSAPRSVGSYPWKNTYPLYVARMNKLAKSLGVDPDQIELFLYLIGPHFR